MEEAPPGWGSDLLSAFLDQARVNAFATFENLKGEYARLAAIDRTFRRLVDVIDGLRPSEGALAGIFLLRAHSAFLASSHLAVSTHVIEAFGAARACIEAALYGLYLTRKPEIQQTWLSRHKGEAEKKASRNALKISLMLEVLQAESRPIMTRVHGLYDHTIDYGAHPNERSITQALDHTEEDGSYHFALNYLVGAGLPLEHCLKVVAQVGVSVLEVFRLIWPERAEISLVSEEIEQLKHGL